MCCWWNACNAEPTKLSGLICCYVLIFSVELANLAADGYNTHASQVSFFETRPSSKLIRITEVDIKEQIGHDV